MATVISNKVDLILVGDYKDGLDRTTTIANPKANITAAEINALGTLNATNQIQRGFLRYKKATRRTTIVTRYTVN